MTLSYFQDQVARGQDIPYKTVGMLEYEERGRRGLKMNPKLLHEKLFEKESVSLLALMTGSAFRELRAAAAGLHCQKETFYTRYRESVPVVLLAFSPHQAFPVVTPYLKLGDP